MLYIVGVVLCCFLSLFCFFNMLLLFFRFSFFFCVTTRQMHETKHLTVPVYAEPADAPSGEPVPEAQPLAEEGAQESKGDRTYPV